MKTGINIDWEKVQKVLEYCKERELTYVEIVIIMDGLQFVKDGVREEALNFAKLKVKK